MTVKTFVPLLKTYVWHSEMPKVQNSGPEMSTFSSFCGRKKKEQQQKSARAFLRARARRRLPLLRLLGLHLRSRRRRRRTLNSSSSQLVKCVFCIEKKDNNLVVSLESLPLQAGGAGGIRTWQKSEDSEKKKSKNKRSPAKC